MDRSLVNYHGTPISLDRILPRVATISMLISMSRQISMKTWNVGPEIASRVAWSVPWQESIGHHVETP